MSALPAAARLPLAAGLEQVNGGAAWPRRGKGGGFGRDPERPKSREGRGEEGGGAGGERQRRAHALCWAVPYWNEAASGALGSRSPGNGGGLEKLSAGEARGGGVRRRAERVGPQLVGTFCRRSAGPAGFFRAPEVWMRGKKAAREEEEEGGEGEGKGRRRRQEAGAAGRRQRGGSSAPPVASRSDARGCPARNSARSR